MYRPEISACDNCGLCCSRKPCLLGGFGDVKRLAKALKKSLRATLRLLQLERNEGGEIWVRIKPVDGRCPFHVNNRCQVHEAKPRGGAEFKCWDQRTFMARYPWAKPDIEKLARLG